MATTIPLPSTTEVQITRVVKALYDAAPGNLYLNAFKEYAAENGGVVGVADALLYEHHNKTNADLAQLIVDNLGLAKVDEATGATGANSAADNAKAFLLWQFNVAEQTGATRGQVLVDALNNLATLGSDPIFGKAADFFNASIAQAYSYSVDPANSTYDLAVLEQADEVGVGEGGEVIGQIVGKTFTLTANSDAITGTSGNDTIAGVNNATATQFTTTDVINGGAGTDKLVLELNADYGGGASISNIEVLQLTGTAADVDFNAAGITGLQEVIWNATGTTPDITNLGSAANITIQNDATGQTYGVAYADSAVAGSADAVKLTLNAVTGAATINLNNTTATTGATGIETLTVDLAGAAGSATNTVTLATNATASLKNVVVTGAGAGNLTVGTNITTTATTIDASATTGGLTLAGIGAAAHTITLGSGNDSVDMGGNLTSADTVKGGAGTDTIASTAANWNTLNTAAAVLANVTEFETLRVTDDAASGVSATIDAALVGAVNLRLAGQTQAGGETVTVNNLGGSTGTANVRFDAAVTGVTLNVKDATLPGSANVVNLDVRGTSATSTFTMNGVETVNVDASNAVTAHTLAMTDAALTTLKITNTGAATFDTGTLGANVSSVDASAVTGGGAVTITLNGTANTGANVTGSAGADTITGSNQLDVINSGAGNDVIIQSLGNDRINVGTGTDDFRMVDLGDNNTAITITAGTTIDVVAEGFDIVSGMGTGDTIRLAANFNAVGAAGANTAVTAVAFNTTFADNGANLVRGNYNSSNGTFTISATGADSLFVADVDDTSGTSDFSGIVLVGYATAATAANLVDQGAFVNFTLIA